jgi:hypothetical protein
VQVEAPQVLPVLTFLDDRGHGAGVGAVGRRSQTNTVIVSRPGGAGYIRIEAVNSPVNQAWGRLFEKAASNPAFFANQHRLRRTLSWTICAKLANRFPPNGPSDVGGIHQLVSYFQTLGMDATEAREGLMSMLSFAYGR